MNLKNKHLATTLRIILGAFMLFFGVAAYVFEIPAETPQLLIDHTNMLKSNGIFHMIKVTEIISGIMLILNIAPALAIIFLAPIAVGIIVFHAMLMPSQIAMGIIVAAFEAYFGYYYWDKYKKLFTK